MDQAYRTIQACELSGASYRQADYWDRTGVLVPAGDAKGSGSQRLYSLRQVQTMWVLRHISLLPHATRFVTARAVCEAEHFGGWLLAADDHAELVPHVLALADLLTDQVSPVAVLDLDRCPVQQEVLV